MKKLFYLSMIMLMNISSFAQPPQKMSYQAVIRNSSGQLVPNHVVGMRISFLQSSATGTAVYVETQTPTTNANGLATIEIGGGTVLTGIFTGIDWSAGLYFIKTETDPTGGTNYTITGTSQILSVPYALFAKRAETATDAVKITEDQTIEGNKTFSGTVTVPAPVNANDPATKAYVDALKGHYVGEIYGGGIVFYVDNSGQHGLISEFGILWSIWSNVQTQIGSTAQSPWNGMSNSLAIYNQPGQTTSAAKTCFLHQSWTGMDDWFLPSIAQLNLLHNASYQINYATVTNINVTPIGGLVWSSTEDSAEGYGQALDLSTGKVYSYQKSVNLAIRPIRKF